MIVLKRFIAVVLAAFLLTAFGTFALAMDFDSPGAVGDSSKYDELSGYEDRFRVQYDGDFGYFTTENGQGAIVVAYEGDDELVTVPEKLNGLPVVSIGGQAFWHNEDMEECVLPEGITSIDVMAFYMCPNLKKVTIPEGVVSIGQCCFGGCAALEEVEMASTVETISDFAFLACTSMKEISFSGKLQSIGISAFQMCVSLEKIILPEKVEIGEDAFMDCPKELQIVRGSL